jgi:hypothetical protein
MSDERLTLVLGARLLSELGNRSARTGLTQTAIAKEAIRRFLLCNDEELIRRCEAPASEDRRWIRRQAARRAKELLDG